MQGIAQLSASRSIAASIVAMSLSTACAPGVSVSGTAASGGSSDTTTPATTPVTTLVPTPATNPVTNPVSPPTAGPNPSASATLTWVAPALNTDGTALTELVGYHIYYGTSTTQLNQEVILNSASTSYVMSGLTTGTYYFAVTAVSSQGTESTLSNIASKTF